MRRIARNWDELATQLRLAANGIAAEPAWPGSAPSQASLETLSDEIRDLMSKLIEAENVMEGLRFEFAKAKDEGQKQLRLVDYTVRGLYPEGHPRLGAYGIKPIDTTRNSPGPTPKVEKLKLADGLAAGSLDARWKSVPRATYEIQWFGDETLETLMGAMASTRREATIPALPPGRQIWIRVRALRGRKYGEWSDTVTRIANV